jgi:hypothetical protein
MTAAQFVADLEAKPAALRALAVGSGPPLSPGSLLRGSCLAAPPAARIPVEWSPW